MKKIFFLVITLIIAQPAHGMFDSINEMYKLNSHSSQPDGSQELAVIMPAYLIGFAHYILPLHLLVTKALNRELQIDSPLTGFALWSLIPLTLTYLHYKKIEQKASESNSKKNSILVDSTGCRIAAIGSSLLLGVLTGITMRYLASDTITFGCDTTKTVAVGTKNILAWSALQAYTISSKVASSFKDATVWSASQGYAAGGRTIVGLKEATLWSADKGYVMGSKTITGLKIAADWSLDKGREGYLYMASKIKTNTNQK